MTSVNNRNPEYQRIRKERALARKKLRDIKSKERRVRRDSYYCRGCGEDPYCYCGDGTPYSY